MPIRQGAGQQRRAREPVRESRYQAASQVRSSGGRRLHPLPQPLVRQPRVLRRHLAVGGGGADILLDERLLHGPGVLAARPQEVGQDALRLATAGAFEPQDAQHKRRAVGEKHPAAIAAMAVSVTVPATALSHAVEIGVHQPLRVRVDERCRVL